MCRFAPCYFPPTEDSTMQHTNNKRTQLQTLRRHAGLARYSKPVRYWVALGLLLLALPGFAQQEPGHDPTDSEHPTRPLHISPSSAHTSSYLHNDTSVHKFREFFSHGHVHGRVRNYFMATLNYDSLPNHVANATGGALGYRTAQWHGFQLGLSGIFTFRTYSHNLTQPDEISGKTARWEQQLFDLEDPENGHDLDRLEELYLAWRFGQNGSHIKFGRQDITSPLMNPQDTRMKPYIFEGLYGEYNEFRFLELSLGWFTRTSPRSTVEWFGITDAIGLYNSGRDIEGNPAHFHGHLNSRGVVVLGAGFQPREKLRFQLWNYFIDNLQNTSLLQADYTHTTPSLDYIGGVQYLHQRAVNQGGSTEPEHEYYDPNQTTNLLSGRLGVANSEWTVSANYTRVLATGRFLFPREWGREHFYTTIGRGRIEGLGDAETYMGRFTWHPTGKLRDLNVEIALGHTNTPAQDNYELNKYGAESWNQFNFDVRYKFHQLLEGLSLRFLYVHKRHADNDTSTLAKLHNSSHFHHFNFISEILF